MGNSSTRWQFVPRQVSGDMDGASQVLPTGSGQMLYYEVIDGGETSSVAPGGPGTNSQGSFAVPSSFEGRRVGIIAYDFINSRWACLFTSGGLISTHQSTTYNDDIGAIKFFITTLSSPPIPLLDQVGDDVPWPASFKNIGSE